MDNKKILLNKNSFSEISKETIASSKKAIEAYDAIRKIFYGDGVNTAQTNTVPVRIKDRNKITSFQIIISTIIYFLILGIGVAFFVYYI